MKALFDTNVLIDYLSGVDGARDEIARHDVALISAITWMEVMAGAKPAEEDTLRAFLRQFRVVAVDEAVMETTVAIRREHGIKLSSAIIWATARREYALLVTRDQRAFPAELPDVRVPYQVHDRG
ncbi:type II toxin-antitoxin system VapC family toxin [Spiribacter vilamensis]|uniref:Ribonuclease VapC n=1 Tax=Spiribacter vilamensis TaxID=531306 RepID=A0A4Q8D2P3_9GAMM|nr:type II toxin-antitoxin system VapC family toxin [Spiribacter vilamensis]RZU99633.1 hypothetical protein EV698_1928 [Spiribacter vilamensis]TVO61409.1 type II toxin-antitoxin system VapC family toxin [Spiribacter vilamensis]